MFESRTEPCLEGTWRFLLDAVRAGGNAVTTFELPRRPDPLTTPVATEPSVRAGADGLRWTLLPGLRNTTLPAAAIPPPAFWRTTTEAVGSRNLPEAVTKISRLHWGQTSLLVRSTGRMASGARQWMQRNMILWADLDGVAEPSSPA